MTLVAGITAVLFAWAIALSLVALWLRLLRGREQRRKERVELVWRERIDQLLLDGIALPPAERREQPVLLELLLRYLDLLRGPEAGLLTAYLEDEGYVARAVEGLRSRNRWTRAMSAVQLGRMRSDTGVAALVDLMDDESADVRMVAARSLAAIGDPAAVDALTAALADPSRWTATTVAADLVEMGPAAVPTLIEIAASSDSGRPGAHAAAVTAVRVLGEIRDPRAEPVLIELLESSGDLNMRARAAAALGAVGGPLAPPVLRDALRDPAWQVRAQAATSLGALGDRDGVAALTEAIVDEAWWVRLNCAEALARLGAGGRMALLALSFSSDPYVADRCRAVLDRLSEEAGG
jgi:HEAT repeat protein